MCIDQHCFLKIFVQFYIFIWNIQIFYVLSHDIKYNFWLGVRWNKLESHCCVLPFHTTTSGLLSAYTGLGTLLGASTHFLI